jgi:hypothetical protein
VTKWAIVAVVVSALIAPTADAAMSVRLAVSPRAPRVGQGATILLRPFTLLRRDDGSCCHLVPAKVQYPFRLQVIGPNAAVVLVRPRRTRNAYIWRTRVTFPRAGRWEIRVRNYYTRACTKPVCRYRGPRKFVVVKPTGE